MAGEGRHYLGTVLVSTLLCLPFTWILSRILRIRRQEQEQTVLHSQLSTEEVDGILVLGGDGTLIQAARDTVNRRIPLLGINLGTLGYLAEIEKAGVGDALDSLMAEQYTIEPRMMLEGRVYRNGGETVQDIALNDIVVNRAGDLRMIDY